MDRRIVYIDQNLLDIDLLGQNKNVMIAFSMALKALLGTSTLVDGLACTPTGPASLQVLVAPGSIYALENVDSTAYGSIAADTAHQIVKQGISLDTQTLSCPAPGTTGQSINYLVQVAYQDTDTGAEVLPYFDSTNPDQAFNGPNNTGDSQNTTREGQCLIQVKAGVAATTGSQTTPAPDAGFTGLWVVTVANSQTTIVSGNIAQVNGAPFISEKLGDKISIPTGDARYLQIGSGVRTRITTNTTLYVATTGNDSTGNGSSGAPWLTRQHALNYVSTNLDIAQGVNLTIQCADGTYTDAATLSAPIVGGGSLIVQGNLSTPSNCVISTTSANCIDCQNNAVLFVCGFKLQTTTSGNCLNANEGGKIFITGAMEYGACAGSHRVAQGGGAEVNNNGNPSTISGSAVNHLSAGIQGQITDVVATQTLTGTPAFSGAYANAQVNSSIVANGNTYSGSANAGSTKYQASLGGVINTGGAGSSYFPGGVSGSTSSGGQYA